LDGFNDGRQSALFGEEPHDYDQYCEGETNPDSGVEWTKGYDTAFNVTCAFTPGTINDHCNGDNQTFSGYIHSLAYDFGIGVKKMTRLHKQSNVKSILWTTIVILVTAETACILTAETIDLIFYRQSLFISIPLSLLAGAFAVAVPEAYKRTKLLG
jgi:hypothetical protein